MTRLNYYQFIARHRKADKLLSKYRGVERSLNKPMPLCHYVTMRRRVNINRNTFFIFAHSCHHCYDHYLPYWYHYYQYHIDFYYHCYTDTILIHTQCFVVIIVVCRYVFLVITIIPYCLNQQPMRSCKQTLFYFCRSVRIPSINVADGNSLTLPCPCPRYAWPFHNLLAQPRWQAIQ